MQLTIITSITMPKNINFQVDQESIGFVCGAYHLAQRLGVEQSKVDEVLLADGFNAVSLHLGRSVVDDYLENLNLDNVKVVTRAKGQGRKPKSAEPVIGSTVTAIEHAAKFLDVASAAELSEQVGFEIPSPAPIAAEEPIAITATKSKAKKVA